MIGRWRTALHSRRSQRSGCELRPSWSGWSTHRAEARGGAAPAGCARDADRGQRRRYAAERPARARGDDPARGRRDRACAEEINAAGAQIKSLEEGLLDFPSRRDGELVLLCWKLGEDEIALLARRRRGLRRPEAAVTVEVLSDCEGSFATVREAFPAQSTPTSLVGLPFNCVLVRTDDTTLLIDTGIGPKPRAFLPEPEATSARRARASRCRARGRRRRRAHAPARRPRRLGRVVPECALRRARGRLGVLHERRVARAAPASAREGAATRQRRAGHGRDGDRPGRSRLPDARAHARAHERSGSARRSCSATSSRTSCRSRIPTSSSSATIDAAWRPRRGVACSGSSRTRRAEVIVEPLPGSRALRARGQGVSLGRRIEAHALVAAPRHRRRGHADHDRRRAADRPPHRASPARA